ncbi:MAG: radical SAM protein, partial [Deltaproteobacteria bacterium]|nr:radical SAM protein [Deltaproteobacteria bacterium]
MSLQILLRAARAVAPRGAAAGFLGRAFLPWMAERPSRWRPGLRTLAHLEAAARRRRRTARRLDIDIPSTMVVSVTSACNLRCPSCAVLDTVGHPARVLDRPTLDRLLAEGREIGVSRIALVGGEPLMAEPVDGLVADNADLFFMIFTNGRPLTPLRADAYAALGNVAFVLNAGTGNRCGAVDRLDEGVEKALVRMRSSGLLAGVAATVSSANVDFFAASATLDTLRSLGARFAIFFDYQVDLADVRGHDDLRVAPPRRRGFVEAVRRWAAERRFHVVLAPEDEAILAGGCGAAGREMIHVSAYGTLDPCPFVPFSRFHVSDHGLLDVLCSEY